MGMGVGDGQEEEAETGETYVPGGQVDLRPGRADRRLLRAPESGGPRRSEWAWEWEMARKKKQRPAKPTCLEGKWTFGPDVPTDDFFEHQNPEDHGDLNGQGSGRWPGRRSRDRRNLRAWRASGPSARTCRPTTSSSTRIRRTTAI